MGDTPAIAFGILCLALGILFHRKRAKIVGAGGAPGPGGAAGAGKASKFRIPAPVLTRIISGLMFFGGVGLASTFIGAWLNSMDFTIGELPSRACIIILAVLLFFALLIDVFNGNGLKSLTYGMIVAFPMLWTAAGGSLSWPRAISATLWTWMTGSI